jgi:hypothetical protein
LVLQGDVVAGVGNPVTVARGWAGGYSEKMPQLGRPAGA